MEIIRKLEKNDIETVVNLEEKFLHETIGEDILTESIELPHMYFFVMELDQKVIGYIGSYILYEEAELLNFVIDEEHQHKGYGQKLLNHILEIAKEKEVLHITLEVRVDNTKAINFYQKNNFKTVSIRKRYYSDGTDAYLMQKEIYNDCTWNRIKL